MTESKARKLLRAHGRKFDPSVQVGYQIITQNELRHLKIAKQMLRDMRASIRRRMVEGQPIEAGEVTLRDVGIRYRGGGC